jgi:hypothetical protein
VVAINNLKLSRECGDRKNPKVNSEITLEDFFS